MRRSATARAHGTKIQNIVTAPAAIGSASTGVRMAGIVGRAAPVVNVSRWTSIGTRSPSP
jgi:hypothetical protein